MSDAFDTARRSAAMQGLGAAVWVAGWAAMVLLDGPLDLANLALLFVLTSMLSALWLPAWLSIGAALGSAVAFNWLFVPPRGTFEVELHQHAVLLASMVVISALVAALMARLRRQADAVRHAADRAEQLRAWGETLRDADDPRLQVGHLRDALVSLTGRSVALLVLKGALPERNESEQALLEGPADADQLAGLWHCLRQGAAMGPGTERHRELPAWYVPMRGRGACAGAALIDDAVDDGDPTLLAQAQALCDQMGVALQRAQAMREQTLARERAQAQEVRSALLAAIAHDHRTPLATIIGAASSLQQQSARLSSEQRARLVRTVLDEASHLSRMTDNTLQLARLDAPGVQLRCDWESAEEMVGTVLRRAREHWPHRAVRARLEPGLPLVWCDTTLLMQLLDNLVDNALKYSADDAPVELLVRRIGEHVVLAVRDRGPGIAPAWRERVFDPFQRGAEALDAQASAQVLKSRPGVGVGLAVCRAIARVHGGELRLRARGHGGCSFECWLPFKVPPLQPDEREAPP